MPGGTTSYSTWASAIPPRPGRPLVWIVVPPRLLCLAGTGVGAGRGLGISAAGVGEPRQPVQLVAPSPEHAVARGGEEGAR